MDKAKIDHAIKILTDTCKEESFDSCGEGICPLCDICDMFFDKAPAYWEQTLANDEYIKFIKRG